ncbi:MAG: DUF4381 domain-containing protein [Gammaproteobacteria bacterium]|nr:DUF4381 domain-containing protein [Gammaproteobacteria bacterium]
MEPGTLVLRDIHGFGSLPWWPMAPGWWYVIGALGLLLLLVVIRYWMVYTGVWLGWRGDARRQLRMLKKALHNDDPLEVAGRLSELLRRIAMARSARREAAGLTGDDWLRWLNEHDTSRFDWEQHGQMLLTAPYMPPVMEVQRNELVALISAASRWVDAKDPSASHTGTLQRLKQRMSGKAGSSHA